MKGGVIPTCYINMKHEKNIKGQIIMYIAQHSLDKEYIYDIIKDNKHETIYAKNK